MSVARFRDGPSLGRARARRFSVRRKQIVVWEGWTWWQTLTRDIPFVQVQERRAHRGGHDGDARHELRIPQHGRSQHHQHQPHHHHHPQQPLPQQPLPRAADEVPAHAFFDFDGCIDYAMSKLQGSGLPPGVLLPRPPAGASGSRWGARSIEDVLAILNEVMEALAVFDEARADLQGIRAMECGPRGPDRARGRPGEGRTDELRLASHVG